MRISPSRASRCSETVTGRSADPEPLSKAARTRHLALVLDVVDRLEVALGCLRSLRGRDRRRSSRGAQGRIYAHSASEGSTSKPGSSGPWTRIAASRRPRSSRRCPCRDRRAGSPREARWKRAVTASRSARLAATPPTTAIVVAPVRSAAACEPGHELVDRGNLEARGEVGDHLRVGRDAGLGQRSRTEVADEIPNRGLEPAERERPVEAGPGQRKAGRISCTAPRAGSPAPPGYSRPSSRATLSNASPAASSRVAASRSATPCSRSTTHSVCPPLTSSARYGGSRSVSASQALYTCPARWETPTIGSPRASAALGRVHRADDQAAGQPGPARDRHGIDGVPATRHGRERGVDDGRRAPRGARAQPAPGTTPPWTACRAICDDTTEERTSRPSLSTAAAVSSQEVSMARRFRRTGTPSRGRRRPPRRRARSGSR